MLASRKGVWWIGGLGCLYLLSSRFQMVSITLRSLAILGWPPGIDNNTIQTHETNSLCKMNSTCVAKLRDCNLLGPQLA